MALSTEVIEAINHFKYIAYRLPKSLYLSKRKFTFLQNIINSLKVNKSINEIKDLADRLPDPDHLSNLFLSYIIQELPAKEGESIFLDIYVGKVKNVYRIKFEGAEKIVS
jgi:hypothetical protein